MHGAPLELIHSDVCGKVNTRSLGGAEDEVFKRLVEWKAMVEKSSGGKEKLL